MAFRGILPEVPSFGTQLARGLGVGIGSGISKATDIAEKLAIKKAESSQAQQLLQSLYHEDPTARSIGEKLSENREQSPGSIGDISDEKIAALATIDPNLAKIIQQQKDSSVKKFESERKFHSKRSEKFLEEADLERQSLRKKENAIGLLENAIQEMPGGFSTDYLAEITGYEPFRTSKGAQFKTASKEFLLGNIKRAGSRPNVWIEQQIGDMAAKIGRSKEANETFTTAVRSDLAVEKKRFELLDELEERYLKELGYVPNTIGKQVEKMLKPYSDFEQEKLAYKLREIHERELGMDELKSLKKVTPGTPLTLEKARIIFNKSPGKTDAEKEANAEKIAKKLGYILPRSEIYEGIQ